MGKDSKVAGKTSEWDLLGGNSLQSGRKDQVCGGGIIRAFKYKKKSTQCNQIYHVLGRE